jgi:hypothetical protein
MFGARGAVGGAAAAHHLRRAHAGAETREELEALPDRVLRAIVAEEHELPPDPSDPSNPAVGPDGEPLADPVAETAVDLRETEDDEARAEERLRVAAENKTARARIELARDILRARAERADRATRRRCVAVSRAAAGDDGSPAVIDADDFERFVHRGLDVGAVDRDALARLYACCLRGRPGSRAAVSDALDVDQLVDVVEKRRWRGYWARYVADARRKALDRGPGGDAAAIFGVTREDPMTAPLFPRAGATFSSPGTYLAFAARFLTLPLAAPFVTERRFRGHAEVMYLTRFMLPETLRRWRWSGAAALPLLFYVSPLWCVGAASIFFYGAHRPEFLLPDVAFPALVSALLVSLAAACAAACATAGTTEHPPRAHSGQLRPSHAFPGGRTAIPDDEARILQNHPRVDTVNVRARNAATAAAANAANAGVGALGGVGSGPRRLRARVASARAFDPEGVATAPSSANENALAAALAAESDAGSVGTLGTLPAPSVGTLPGVGTLPAPGNDSARETSAVDPRATTRSTRGSTASESGSNVRGDAIVAGAGLGTFGVERGRDAEERAPRANAPMGGVGAGSRGRRGRATPSARGHGGGAAGGFGFNGRGFLGGGVPLPLEPPGEARDDGAREAARARGSTHRRAETPSRNAPATSEKDVVDAVARRAAEEAAATPFVGSKPLGWTAKFCMFLVGLALASIPPAHRRTHGAPVFGGAERVTLCVDQLMPESVANAVGFAKCSTLVQAELEAARAERDALLNGDGNGTYVLPPPAPGVGEGAAVEDLVLSSVVADRVGSTPGHVVVGAGVIWTSAATYLLLAALRWLVARCYAHYLRERLFAACTDPSEAALFDVPYLNLRHASLPWLRARVYLARSRYLERRWAELAAAHLVFAVAGLTIAAGIAAARIFTSPYQDVDAALPASLAHAVVLSIALTALTTIASKCAALQEDDEALARDEKWKMTVDGEKDPATRAAMTDLADVVRRRNRVAWPRLFGVRCREWVAHASAAYTLFLVAAFFAVVATELAGGPYEGASVDQLKAFVEVNFAYAHKFSQRLLDRVESLADNVTRVEAGVNDARVLVSTIDNVSPRQTLEAVRDMAGCMDCAAPEGETRLRPWYADAAVEATYDAMRRSYYRRVDAWATACPAGANRPAWCDAPEVAEPAGRAECVNLGSQCVNSPPPPASG